MAATPKALICLDFDGTLVGGSESCGAEGFPLALGSYLEKLSAAGVVWAIGTGRSLFQAVEGITQHQIDPLPDFLMPSERHLYWRGRFNRWNDVGDWNTRCGKDHRKLFRGHARFFRRIRTFVENETGARYVSNAQEPAGIVSTSEEEMDTICEYIDRSLAKAKNLAYERNSIYLRFSHVGYSKGTVLAELSRHLGLEPSRVFAAGDNYNDLSMLDGTHAEMVACPANAVSTVKETVSSTGGVVASTTAGAGVLEALQYYFGELASG